MTSRTIGRNVAIYAVLAIAMVFFICPIGWFIALAIRPPETAFLSPPEFTFMPTLDAFRHILVDPGANAPQLANSVIVAGCAVLLNLPFPPPPLLRCRASSSAARRTSCSGTSASSWRRRSRF